MAQCKLLCQMVLKCYQFEHVCTPRWTMSVGINSLHNQVGWRMNILLQCWYLHALRHPSFVIHTPKLSKLQFDVYSILLGSCRPFVHLIAWKFMLWKHGRSMFTLNETLPVSNFKDHPMASVISSGPTELCFEWRAAKVSTQATTTSYYNCKHESLIDNSELCRDLLQLGNMYSIENTLFSLKEVFSCACSSAAKMLLL